MTAIRRLLTLTGLIVAVVIGSSIPASAGFAETASLPTMTVGTTTVAAPSNITGYLSCAKTSSTMQVTWSASTSERVSGYRVTVHFSDGYDQSETVAATATSWSAPIDTYYVTKYAIQYSITTLTDYGWHTQSTKTGWFQC